MTPPTSTATTLCWRLAAALIAACMIGNAAEAATLRAYIGTYTPKASADAPPNAPRGLGIYRVEIDSITGAMFEPALVARTPSPSWLIVGRRGDILYAANEVTAGTVTAFRIEPASGALTPLNAQPTGGSPVSLALDATGTYLLAANYGGGSVAVLPIRRDGSLAAATDIEPTKNQSTGESTARVHMVGIDRRGRFVIANDSEHDRVHFWRLNTATGTLVANAPHAFDVPRGSFPRHFAISPDNRWFYNLSERDSMLAVSALDVRGTAARLTPRQRLSTLPPGFAGPNATSELLISADGRHLYAANRGHDSIAVFDVSPNRGLTARGTVPTGGAHPRTLAFDPAQRFIFSLNQRSNSITSFRLNPATGMPRATGLAVTIGQPAAMVFTTTD